MKHSVKDIQPARLVYRIAGEEDIVSRFSTEGCDLLSGAFLSFIDLMRPSIPEGAPILLEVTGKKPDEASRRSIDNSIWLHYLLQMTRIDRSLRACRIKIAWFFLCTVLSSVFLYMATKNTDEVAIQFLYLPIWFFGYRLLIFPLQEYLPLCRELKWYRRLAAMKLVFTEKPEGEQAPAGAVMEETSEYARQAMEGIRGGAPARRLLKEDGTVLFRCRAASSAELLNPCSVPGSGLISDELASFLEQLEPFADPERPAELLISGPDFSEYEKDGIVSAVGNYLRLRCRKAEENLIESRRRIVNYSLGLAASSTVLYFCGRGAGLALHEFMLITLWFFGDFLVDYILLGHSDARYKLRLCRRLTEMNIRFETAEAQKKS